MQCSLSKHEERKIMGRVWEHWWNPLSFSLFKISIHIWFELLLVSVPFSSSFLSVQTAAAPGRHTQLYQVDPLVGSEVILITNLLLMIDTNNLDSLIPGGRAWTLRRLKTTKDHHESNTCGTPISYWHLDPDTIYGRASWLKLSSSPQCQRLARTFIHTSKIHSRCRAELHHPCLSVGIPPLPYIPLRIKI